MKGEPVRTFRTYADDEWARLTWTAADPLTVTEPEPLTRERSRDTALVCIAGMVLIAIVAYLLGRAS